MKSILVVCSLFFYWMSRAAESSKSCFLVEPDANFFVGNIVAIVRIHWDAKKDDFADVNLKLSHDCNDNSSFNDYELDILKYDAFRWSLQRINKKFGQIGSRIIQNSFIPGLKLGKYSDTFKNNKVDIYISL